MIAAALILAASIAIPFEYSGGEIFVPVRVNGGEPVPFALDSAASSMILDAGLAARLKLSGAAGEGHGAGAGTVAHTKLSSPVSLAIGPLPPADYPMLAIDLRGPATNIGHETLGLLGYDFFARYVVAIDYARRRMTVSSPDEFQPPRDFIALPLTIDHRLPFVEAEIKVPGVAAAKGRFLIDSGSADAVDHPLIKQSSGHVEKTVTGVGLGTPITGYIGRAEYFKLGPFAVKNPVLACCGGNEFNQQMIGSAILEHFDLIFDFPHKRLYVRRRNGYLSRGERSGRRSRTG